MGIFYIFALIKEGRATTFIQARKWLALEATDREYKLDEVYTLLNGLLDFLTGNSRGADQILNQHLWFMNWQYKTDWISSFFIVFSYYWVDKDEAKKEISTIQKMHNIAKANSYSWFARELEGLILNLSNTKITKKQQNLSCLTELTKESNVWEHTLNALLNLNKKSGSKTPIDPINK